MADTHEGAAPEGQGAEPGGIRRGVPSAFRVASALMALLFGSAAVVQGNDPDPALWVCVYGAVALLSLGAALGRVWVWPSLILCAVFLAGAAALSPAVWSATPLAFRSVDKCSPEDEQAREAVGLFASGVWAGVLWGVARRGRRGRRPPGALPIMGVITVLTGCGVYTSSATPLGPLGHRVPPAGIAVPAELAHAGLSSKKVLAGLDNPRGMLPLQGGGLLLSVAGTGDPQDPLTGSLVRVEDRDGDGAFDERVLLLSRQLSTNIIDIVRRDEVFGMAGIAQGGGDILVSHAMFGTGRSTVYRITGAEVTPWSTVYGNINDLTYDPVRDAWFAVSSSSDEVVLLRPGQGAERVVKLSALPNGQDPVPGYIRHDPITGELLVSLFSGSPLGETGGDGTELMKGAGAIVSVNPDTGKVRPVVTGLTAPTEFEVGEDGRLYVLELCTDFEEPTESRSALLQSPRHGGFRRYSGRLLEIDLSQDTVRVLVDGLDAPTNLALRGQELLVAQGMGTPGRAIPGPSGQSALDGEVLSVAVPARVPVAQEARP